MTTLGRGATGAAVKALQSKLLALGFDPGGIDGKFGVKTERAVRAFQASRQLEVDGQAGRLTLAAFGQSGFDLPKASATARSTPQATTVGDPGQLGPHAVRHSVIDLPLGNGKTTRADVYTPVGVPSSPPVLHLHGLLQSPGRTAGTAHHYASWGLTTVVPTLPHGSGAPGANSQALKAAVDWAMTKPAALGGATLDTSRGVAVSGHSFGALTALLTAAGQKNVGAVVALDPADLMGQGLAQGSRIAAPTAFVVGRAEIWNQFGNGYRIYDRVPGSQNELLRVAGAGHMDFQNGSTRGPKNKANAVAMRFATAFLLRHVGGQTQYAAFTQDGAQVRRAKAAGELR